MKNLYERLKPEILEDIQKDFRRSLALQDNRLGLEAFFLDADPVSVLSAQ